MTPRQPSLILTQRLMLMRLGPMAAARRAGIPIHAATG
jgi:hypothetical protein